MKKILIVPFLLMSLMVYSQVKDLPIAFSKKGYVLAIDFDQKMIQIDFFTADKNLGDEEILRSQVFTLSDCEIINDKKEKIKLSDLRSSDEILVNGQWFQERDEYNIQKITVQPKRSTNELQGKVDLISGEFAYVDGHKVKLGEGKKIKGDDKTGYKGQVYNSFAEIKKGVYAKVSGKYDDAGYFLAKSFIIAPDVETTFDKTALVTAKEIYDKIYPSWVDTVKRKALLGKTIDSLGVITNNEAVQAYVNRIGRKLIPDYIQQKNKIDFIFVVVDNPDLLAYVKANGLAVVYTGLLLNLDSEAQLATILGHEIAHAIYEHHAEENSELEKQEKKKSLFNKGLNIGSNGINTILNTKKGIENKQNPAVKSDKQREAEQQQNAKDKENQAELNGLLSSTISNILDKNAIQYSIDQEYQADRVGLSLATLAGYDPKEAPVVWKKLYERYGKRTTSKSNTFDKQMEAFQELQNRDKEYNTKGLVNQAALAVLTIKKVDYKTKNIRTHPDEVKRYAALNNLIALYWNNPKLLEGTTNNQEEYLVVMNKLAQSKTIEKPVEKQKEKPKEKQKQKPKKKQ